MSKCTIYRIDYPTRAAYLAEYRNLCNTYDCKTKIDDGQGGTGWMFFRSLEDMRVWKNQK